MTFSFTTQVTISHDVDNNNTVEIPDSIFSIEEDETRYWVEYVFLYTTDYSTFATE